MLQNISWQAYWVTLAITLLIYYSVVLVLFYRSSILERIYRKDTQNPDAQPSFFQKGVTASNTSKEPEADSVVPSLVSELHAFFQAAGPRAYTKEALLQSIKMIIRKYRGEIDQSQHQRSINQLLLVLSEQHCAIHLSAAEVSSVWV